MTLVQGSLLAVFSLLRHLEELILESSLITRIPNLMRSFPHFFIILVASVFVTSSSCSTSGDSPIATLGKPPEGLCRVVLVSPVLGVDSHVEIDSEPGRTRPLRRGGSVVYDLDPGVHRIKVNLQVGSQAAEPIISAAVSMEAGETLYLTLNPSRPVGSEGTRHGDLT